MKLVKGLLLGSAAGLTAVAGAQAADLPVRAAPAAVEYVRVCSVHGAGFFYIPGSDTCLRISGYLRAEYEYREPFSRGQDATGFFARGRMNFDARTSTEYGTVRAFVRYDIQRSSGPENAVLLNASQGAADSSSLNQGFIQFAGLTAGRIQSFYDFYANDINFADIFTSDRKTQVLAYTATFGGGFSGTIAIEDPTERRTNIGFAGTNTGVGVVFTGPTAFGAPVSAASNAALFGAGVDPFAQAGTRMPDIVGNLRVDQAWGSAQLSGAIHQVRGLNLFSFPGVAFNDFGDTEYGFAVQGGVKLNMPFTGPGDALWLQAAYAQGAQDYIVHGLSPLGINRNFAGVGDNFGLALPQTDAVFDAVTGDTKLSTAWSLNGIFQHYWTPTIRQGAFVSYAQIDYPGIATLAGPVPGTRNGFLDTKLLRVGSNVIWSPVRNLDLGVEVFYTKVDPQGRQFVGTTATGIPVTVGQEDFWETRLRVQRDF